MWRLKMMVILTFSSNVLCFSDNLSNYLGAAT
jgi:hypothetical protein